MCIRDSNNGIDDNFEPDPDGDGFGTPLQSDANLPDTDGDGIIDVLDQQAAGADFITGLNGGFGCSLQPAGSSRFDPLLAMLAVASLGILGRRKRQSKTH